MAINFTEKQHWKNRIEAKLNQRIARLRREHADLIDELNDQAQDEVVAARGLTGDFEELNRFDDELLALEEKKAELMLTMQIKISGDPDDDDHWSFRRLNSELIALRQERAETLLRDHPCGRQLEDLRNEKERLCDAVMLSTSVNQIIDLWDRVTALVAEQCPEPDQEDLFSESEEQPPISQEDI